MFSSREYGFWTKWTHKAKLTSEEKIQEAGNYYSYNFKPTGQITKKYLDGKHVQEQSTHFNEKQNFQSFLYYRHTAHFGHLKCTSHLEN